MMQGRDQPLRVEVVDDQLVIRIGVDVLAQAMHYAEWNNPWDEAVGESGEYRQLFDVIQANEFAKGVRLALLDEEEDGSTLLTRLLDEAAKSAVENGCEGVEEHPSAAPAAADGAEDGAVE